MFETYTFLFIAFITIKISILKTINFIPDSNPSLDSDDSSYTG